MVQVMELRPDIWSRLPARDAIGRFKFALPSRTDTSAPDSWGLGVQGLGCIVIRTSFVASEVQLCQYSNPSYPNY